ncbi:YceI family protein [Algoriphagus namhaensis]|uniref:YceI family protein n=1 Tax=Algoriphagus namhaensis TaxID=915353 RepID=A0ABV8ASU9_9BACT
MRLLVLFLFLVASPVFAQKYVTEKGQTIFISEAPLSSFEGVSKNLNGLIDLDQNLLDFYLDLNTLETGIGLRDRHMRENYLETEQFPFAEFTGKLQLLPDLKLNAPVEVKAIGTFKIHGVEKEIEVFGTLTKVAENQVQLDASFEVLLSDYSIPLPKLVFYELAENQKVTLNAILTQKK